MGTLCYEARLSLLYFFGLAVGVFFLGAQNGNFEGGIVDLSIQLWESLLYYVLINILLRFFLQNKCYQIAVRASLLGFFLAMGILIVIYASAGWKSLGIYMAVMSTFHYGEFLGIAWSNPQSLNVDSFILNHSIHYAVAALSSWIEFLVEIYFFPGLKDYHTVWLLGVVICLVGEFLRKSAMITAGSNFNHLVQFEKTEHHELVTQGVYKFMRHPSYVGFFWWSIGTQIILLNPICIILYAITSWKFFNDRIFIEEITLLNFFGSNYYEYQQHVPTGLPFIKGYEI